MKLRKGTLLFLLLTCLAYTASAQVVDYILQGSDVTIDDDGIITGCTYGFDTSDDSKGTKLTIPKSVTKGTETITIKGIRNDFPGIFQDKKLVSVEFAGDSEVTTIGVYAFYQNNITTLTLPPSLTVIGDSAFYNNSLTTVTFNVVDQKKSHIEIIGSNAFSGNTGLTGITLPEHAEGTGVIYKDSNNQEYSSGETFTNFGSSLVIIYILTADDVTVDKQGMITACTCTFSTNTEGINLKIPKSVDKPIDGGGVETIIIKGIVDRIDWRNPGVFEEKNIISLTFASDSEITTIGDAAFRGNSLTTLTLPNSLTTIGTLAFGGNSLTTLTLPNSLTTIGSEAFGDNSLTTLTLPNTLTTIGDSAFASNSLTTLTLPNSLTTIGVGAFINNKITTLDLSAATSLETIGGYAFFNNKITTLDLSVATSLETIGQYAFQNNLITTLDLSTATSLETIEVEAFENNLITTLSLPPSLKIIGIRAFRKNKLTAVTFKTTTNEKSQINTIRGEAFDLNPSLPGIILPDNGNENFVLYQDFNGNTYNPGDTFPGILLLQIAISYTLSDDDVVVEEGAIISSSYNFPVGSGTYLIMPEILDGQTIIRIGSSVFSDKNIKHITLPKSIVTIEDRAFGHNQLTTLDLSYLENLESIGNEGFSFNRTTTLSLPPSLKSIGNRAFNAHRLTTLDLSTLTSLKTIGDFAFTKSDGDDNLVSVILPSSLEKIGNQVFLYFTVDLPTKEEEGKRYYWTIEGSKDEVTQMIAGVPGIYIHHSIEQVILTLKIGREENQVFVEDNIGNVNGMKNGENEIDKDIEITLEAIPNAGYEFEKWSINDGSTDVNVTENRYSTTFSSQATINAYFKEVVLANIVTLTVNKVGLGSVDPGVGENNYEENTPVTLTATPETGWRFDKWVISDEENKTDKVAITLDADKTATAHFVQLVTLTTAVAGQQGGTIAPLIDPNGKVYDIKTKVELTATPDEGWRFDKWEISDEENKTDKTTTITLDKNKSVTAHFVKEEEEEAITSILTEVVSATPYPNPVTSQITLKAKDGDLIQLFSPKGKQQYSAQHTGNEVHTIDVSTLPVGVYLVRITDAEGNTTTKRIVKK